MENYNEVQLTKHKIDKKVSNISLFSILSNAKIIFLAINSFEYTVSPFSKLSTTKILISIGTIQI